MSKTVSVGVLLASTTVRGTGDDGRPSPHAVKSAVMSAAVASVLGSVIVARSTEPLVRPSTEVKLWPVPVIAGSWTVAEPTRVTVEPPTSATLIVMVYGAESGVGMRTLNLERAGSGLNDRAQRRRRAVAPVDHRLEVSGC